jgi:hypothetical protein
MTDTIWWLDTLILVLSCKKQLILLESIFAASWFSHVWMRITIFCGLRGWTILASGNIVLCQSFCHWMNYKIENQLSSEWWLANIISHVNFKVIQTEPVYGCWRSWLTLATDDPRWICCLLWLNRNSFRWRNTVNCAMSALFNPSCIVLYRSWGWPEQDEKSVEYIIWFIQAVSLLSHSVLELSVMYCKTEQQNVGWIDLQLNWKLICGLPAVIDTESHHDIILVWNWTYGACTDNLIYCCINIELRPTGRECNIYCLSALFTMSSAGCVHRLPISCSQILNGRHD